MSPAVLALLACGRDVPPTQVANTVEGLSADAASGCGVNLVATLAFKETQRTPATATLANAMPFTVPPALQITNGGTKNGHATLQFSKGGGSPITCSYDLKGGGSSFGLTSCGDGANGGAPETADTFTLTIQTADHGADTTGSQIQITATLTAPNGTACTGTNMCFQTHACQAGACTGSNPIVCLASDQCHDVGTCDPARGVCSNPAKADGSACDDGSACTQVDACTSGACVGANPIECTPADDCHDVGTCDPSTSQCSNPLKADVSACSVGEVIDASGGLLEHPLGASVSIPAGAFTAPSPVVLATVQASSLPVQVPADFSILGVIRLDFNATATSPLRLVFPTPSFQPSGGWLLLAKLIEIAGKPRLSVVETLAFDGGAVHTNSPPMPGVKEPGTYVFLAAALGTPLVPLSLETEGGNPVKGAVVELAAQVVPAGEAQDPANPFVGVSAADGFTAIPAPAGAATASVFAAADATPATLIGQATFAIPPEILTPALQRLQSATLGLVLKAIGVDPKDLPGDGEPCGALIDVDPHYIPAQDRFYAGDRVQLRVTDALDADVSTSDLPTGENLLEHARNKDWDFRETLYYRLFDTPTPPDPFEVSEIGLVHGLAEGRGSIPIFVNAVCFRKMETPVGPIPIPILTSYFTAVKSVIVTGLQPADLQVSASFVSANPIAPGDTFTYQFDLGNGGPAEAREVLVSIQLPDNVSAPSGLVNIAGSSNSGLCATSGAENEVDCFIDRLPNGSQLQGPQITVAVGVIAAAPGPAGAQVTVQCLNPDPDSTNNADAVSTTIKCLDGQTWNATTQLCVPDCDLAKVVKQFVEVFGITQFWVPPWPSGAQECSLDTNYTVLKATSTSTLQCPILSEGCPTQDCWCNGIGCVYCDRCNLCRSGSISDCQSMCGTNDCAQECFYCGRFNSCCVPDTYSVPQSWDCLPDDDAMGFHNYLTPVDATGLEWTCGSYHTTGRQLSISVGQIDWFAPGDPLPDLAWDPGSDVVPPEITSWLGQNANCGARLVVHRAAQSTGGGG